MSARWTTGDEALATETMTAIAAAVSRAYDDAPGETCCWHLLSMGRKVVERMGPNILDPALDEGHVCDDAIKLRALLLGALHVGDAPQVEHWIDAALLLLPDLFQRLGYAAPSWPSDQKGPS